MGRLNILTTGLLKKICAQFIYYIHFQQTEEPHQISNGWVGQRSSVNTIRVQETFMPQNFFMWSLKR